VPSYVSGGFTLAAGCLLLECRNILCSAASLDSTKAPQAQANNAGLSIGESIVISSCPFSSGDFRKIISLASRLFNELIQVLGASLGCALKLVLYLQLTDGISKDNLRSVCVNY